MWATIKEEAIILKKEKKRREEKRKRNFNVHRKHLTGIFKYSFWAPLSELLIQWGYKRS